jgi:hypothetical protein
MPVSSLWASFLLVFRRRGGVGLYGLRSAVQAHLRLDLSILRMVFERS